MALNSGLGHQTVNPLVTIDGSMGEGGGQILRSSLSLSMVTGRPFEIVRLRAGREKPGLKRQHLTALRAAAEICSARVGGDEINSQSVRFEPGSIRPGEYHFAVGTAGSTMLVLQAVLPGLMTASKPSRLVLEGGTHVPFAPTYDFVDVALRPMLERMGCRVSLSLTTHGFFPSGGGRVIVDVEPSGKSDTFDVCERGELTQASVNVLLQNLDEGIAKRELAALRRATRWDPRWRSEIVQKRGHGPGNVMTVVLQFGETSSVVTSLGMRRVSAEKVAAQAARRIQAHLGCEAPIGPYLADQLLVPLAVGLGGRFVTEEPTEHTKTNAQVIEMFSGRATRIEPLDEARYLVEQPCLEARTT